MVIKKCTICGREFEVKPYRKNVARYCSRKCKGADTELSNKIANSSSATKMRRKAAGRSYASWNKGMKGIHLNPKNEFKKGLIPWNKNKKGIHLSPKSEFKKGRVSNNKLPIGTIQIRVNKKRGNVKRKWIKIAEPNKWMQNARYQWREYYQDELKKGCVIHHIDRDTLNDDPENLMQLTKQEHLNEHRGEFQK